MSAVPRDLHEAGPAPRWRFVVSPRWLAWHAFAVVASWGMCWLGDWQFHRAIAGNSLSWAYTFEWPLFAIMGAVFWAKTIRDELYVRSGAVTGAANAVGAAAEPAGAAEPREHVEPGEAADQERGAYDAYLARLHEQVKGHGRWHGLR